ncbi:hypothetical protein [Prochlorococcus sp. MIT 1223]|uniref:hypothetical protein n=1 Tax=Prochlorococcus sp. MIT 1223 TaxID=3096217 RepID=UPI002A74807A|nr:hypothetical protein [Prochlorococcus sp. MIT 1223]
MPTTSSNLKSDDKIKKGPHLPWWVELLFVQIGLPDKWLPKILKRKNKAQKTINENKKRILYTFLFLSTFIYLNQYTKYFYYQNNCIEFELSKSTNEAKDYNISKKEMQAIAVRKCNSNIQSY